MFANAKQSIKMLTILFYYTIFVLQKVFMATSLEQFNVRVPADLKKQFEDALLKGISNQHQTTAMVRFWLSMPDDKRVELIVAESKLSSNHKPRKSGK